MNNLEATNTHTQVDNIQPWSSICINISATESGNYTQKKLVLMCTITNYDS